MSDQPDITIVLADDHAVVRSGLKLLLEGEEDLEVVAIAGTAEDALRYVRGHKPDVLILDLNMPGTRTSLDIIPEVPEASAGTRVVVLTMQEDPAFARRALRDGATGYVLKEAADEEVVSAVREIAKGGRYVHPTLGARILRSVPFLAPHIPIVELHHERPDGSGYPHQYRGEEIPLLARIVHVTDAFDAMTSARAYRGARSTAEALRELWRCAGAEFDAEVVQALAGALPSIELSSAIDPRPGSVRLALVTSSSGS